MNGNQCPSHEQLQELLSGGELDSEVASHIEDCKDCQSSLDQLSDPEALSGYRESSRKERQALHFLEPPLREGDLGSMNGLAIERKIAHGGMGVIFQGRDDKLGRDIAVKILHRRGSQDADARFLRESQAMAKVQDDHVVPIFAFDVMQDGVAYLVMPLIQGSSLKARIAAGSISLRESAQWIQQTALGLAAAHKEGIVHRDVKPENILLDQTDGRAKLIDFGLAKSLEDETLTQLDAVAGTPHYMSPEQAHHPQTRDARSDIYSLGITLYECLTGSRPFTGHPVQILDQHQNTEPTKPSRLRSNIPKDLENICLLAIAKDPGRRYQDAQKFADDLERFLNGRPVHAKETPPLTKLWLWARRNQALATALSLFVLALLLGIVGTSTMWRLSAQNAEKAEEYSASLVSSRERLRESVSRFQQRIFSGESMHWQMTESFRKEMFGDVISYLNEFASTEEEIETEAQRQAALSLTRDFHEIGKAALDVGQLEQARIASSRALERIRESHDESLVALQLHAEILATTIESQLRLAKDSERDAIEALVSEFSDIAQRTQKLAPEHFRTQFCVLRARYFALSLTPSAYEFDEFSSLYHQLIANHDLRAHTDDDIEVLETAIAVSWLAFKRSPEQALALLENNESKVVDSLRNTYRGLLLPLYPTDFLRAQNFRLMAEFHDARGQQEQRDQLLQSSEARLDDALQANPQNRNWRIELADLRLLQTRLLVEQEDYAAAETKIVETVRTYMKIKELEPENDKVNKNVIRLFILMAGIRMQAGNVQAAADEYFIASQDAWILIREGRKWTIEVRRWCLAKTIECLAHADVDSEQIMKSIQHVTKRDRNAETTQLNREDFQILARILAGDLIPDTPTDLNVVSLR